MFIENYSNLISLSEIHSLDSILKINLSIISKILNTRIFRVRISIRNERTCVLFRDKKRLLHSQLLRCIDYHRLFRYRFPSIFVVLSALQGLKTHREAGRSVSSFFFFFLPLLYSFPLSHSTFPICIEMKTYLFGGLRPKSLLSLVEQGMDVPCTREFVHVATYLHEHARFRRAPLLFIRFLLLFSVWRTEPTMKKKEAIHLVRLPTFECIRMYSIIAWFRNLDNSLICLASIVSCNLFDQISSLFFIVTYRSRSRFQLLKIYQNSWRNS